MSPEQFRSNLPGLIAACARLQSLGKKVRYISTAVFPGEARGLCLFGAEEARWVYEVNEVARLPYARIYAVLDLTPSGVRRDLSRGRWPTRVESAPVASPATTNGGPPAPPTPRVAEGLSRWLAEARHLVQALGGLLEEIDHRQAEVGALERDRTALAEEVRRLERQHEALRAEREELSDALEAIVDRTARARDEILSRIGGRRGAPGDLAQR